VHRALLSIKSHTVTSQWFAFERNLGRPASWPEFKEQITIYTRGHAAQTKAADDLAKCVQGSISLDAYAARYTQLVTDAGYPLTDARVIRGFLHGLQDSNFRTVLTGLAPDRRAWPNLTDLVSTASQLAVNSAGGQRHKPKHNYTDRSFSTPHRHSANASRAADTGKQWRGGRGGGKKHFNKALQRRPAGTMKSVAAAVFNQQWQKKQDNRRDRRDDRGRGGSYDDREPGPSDRHKKSKHGDNRHDARPSYDNRGHYDEPPTSG
jgi:hypothetical protein